MTVKELEALLNQLDNAAIKLRELAHDKLTDEKAPKLVKNAAYQASNHATIAVSELVLSLQQSGYKVGVKQATNKWQVLA